MHLNIPRDRNGDFEQHLLLPYARRSDDLEKTIILLYQKGITTREIADLIEKLYGNYYTPATVSQITKAVEKQVDTFHTRRLSERYAVIYMDSTYMNVRRDNVAKEALHVLLGITPDGSRKILDYALYPSESAGNYEEMLEGIKERGVKQVLYRAKNTEEAETGLKAFLEKYKTQYPRLHEIFDRARDSLFHFFEFPLGIRAGIYTTDLIKRSRFE